MDLHLIVSALKKLAKELGRTPTIKQFHIKSNIPHRKIYAHKYSELCKMAGLEPNHGTANRHPLEIESRPPKILILDIETAPIKAYVYGMWDQNISTKQIEKDWFMISWAAKFVGDKEIMYADSSKKKDVSNDKAICKSIHKLMDEADIWIGHNIDRFDVKKLNTRFLFHDLPPLEKKQTIDTLKIAKRYFKITSNKLDFIAKFLGVKGKYQSPKYNGFDLWIACYNKNMEAYKENEIYNKQDVEITEMVFDKLKKWDTTLNFQAFYQDMVCVCGGTKFKKRGLTYSKSGAFQRYRCEACEKSFVSKYNMLSKQQKSQLKLK